MAEFVEGLIGEELLVEVEREGTVDLAEPLEDLSAAEPGDFRCQSLAMLYPQRPVGHDSLATIRLDGDPRTEYLWVYRTVGPSAFAANRQTRKIGRDY
jgi:hypothetical protein